VRPAASDVLVAGPLQLLIIKRGDRLALRLKDDNSKARREFTHLSWCPVEEDWKIKAKFFPSPSPSKIVFDTVIGEQETSKRSRGSGPSIRRPKRDPDQGSRACCLLGT
jgi:uncharacterized protein (DUF1684 family)